MFAKAINFSFIKKYIGAFNMKNDVILGLTLFSVLQKPSKKYVIHKNGYDEYVKELFSETRLDLKSEIFFNLSLPQLALMDRSKCSYTHFLVYSEELPVKYKEKILDAEDKYTFLRALEVGNYEKFNIKDKIKDEVTTSSNFAFFGLDDDDLLSIDYLQRVRRYIKTDFVGFNIIMSKGYSGFYDGRLKNCREVRFPFINIGQVRICKRSEDGGVFIPAKGSHMKTDETCPTVLDSRVPTFFWFRHLVQDTFSKAELKNAILRINKDLDEYPYPSESVVERFPVLKNFLKESEVEKKIVIENIFLEKRKESKVIFEDKGESALCGKIVVNYNLRNVSGSSRRQAIAVFKFSKLLNNNDVVKAGLNLSKIGYYRYFNTGAERSAGSFSIDLPESVYLTGLEAMKWGDESISIDKIEVVQLEKN